MDISGEQRQRIRMTGPLASLLQVSARQSNQRSSQQCLPKDSNRLSIVRGFEHEQHDQHLLLRLDHLLILKISKTCIFLPLTYRAS